MTWADFILLCTPCFLASSVRVACLLDVPYFLCVDWPELTEGILFSPSVIVWFKTIFQVVPKTQPIPLFCCCSQDSEATRNYLVLPFKSFGIKGSASLGKSQLGFLAIEKCSVSSWSDGRDLSEQMSNSLLLFAILSYWAWSLTWGW